MTFSPHDIQILVIALVLMLPVSGLSYVGAVKDAGLDNKQKLIRIILIASGESVFLVALIVYLLLTPG